MKRKIMLSVLVIEFIMLPACEDILTNKERGEQASTEFCECMKKNSLSECEDEMNSKYSYYIDDEFIKAFNNINDCNITISKKKK